MKTTQVAHETGTFRCSNLMSTRHAVTGEEIGPCVCSDNCVWLFFPEDQGGVTELKIVYLNGLEAIGVIEPIVNGATINLFGGMSNYSGAFIITEASNYRGLLGVHARIKIESAGPYDPTLPAFRIRTF